jgi:type VI secretion system protein ImpH
MAAPARMQTHALIAALCIHPQRFEFFEAVRLLEHLRPDAMPLGRGSDAGDEAARFRCDAGFAFPAAELASVAADGPGSMTRVDVHFMGVASPGLPGSLPSSVALALASPTQRNRGALRDFLTLFDHRFVSLFYRAWRRSRVAVCAERAGESGFERAALALIGLGAPALADRLPFSAALLIARAGLLLRRPASPQAVEALLASSFGVPAHVCGFAPRRVHIAPRDRVRLGGPGRLGQNALLGPRAILRASLFRVYLGPLDRARYESFLPEGAAFPALCALLRLAAGADLDFEIRPVLQAADVRAVWLGRAGRRARLSRSAWLARRRVRRDADDAVLRPAGRSDGGEIALRRRGGAP